MKYNPEDEQKLPDFSKLQRQGLYQESQAGGHVKERSPRKLSRFDNNPFKPAPCLAPPPSKVLELEEGCPNFGGGPNERMIPEERDPSWVEPEPMPTKNELPFMWPSAIQRIIEIAKQRDDFGAQKYGTRLQPFNGRDPLVDAFQEGLDKLVYIEQELFERPYKNAVIEAAVALTFNTDALKDDRLLYELCEKTAELIEVQGNRAVDIE